MKWLFWIWVAALLLFLGFGPGETMKNRGPEGTTVARVAKPLSTTPKQELFETAPQPASLNSPATLPQSEDKRAAFAAPEMLFVTGDHVNMRTGPRTEFKVIGKFSKGDRLYLLETQGDWARLNGNGAQGTVSGWMHRDFLASARTAPQAAVAAAPRRQVARPTRAEIARAQQEIIRQSIAAYPGSCPCPFSHDRAGRRCGGRSAWSRPGGYAPVCYESDISQSRLSSYLVGNSARN